MPHPDVSMTLTAVLLGLEDETVTIMAIPAFTSVLKMAVPPKLSARYWELGERDEIAPITIALVEFHYDASETRCQQLLDPSLVIYRRRA